MYDKSFEYRSKGKAVESNILRLETSYRRQNIPLSEFFNDAFVFRLVSQFSRDWHSLSFPHQIIAEKGTKGSQIEKARRIMEVGRDAYLTESRKDMEAGIITPKQYRCIREFVQRWDDYRKLSVSRCMAMELSLKMSFAGFYVLYPGSCMLRQC